MFRRICIPFVPKKNYDHRASYNRKVNVVVKRGQLLGLMSDSRYKKNKRIMANVIQGNVQKSEGVFNMITNLSKRQETINKLFIQNISDVLSTGDVDPGILALGIEITGVKVTQDFKLVNVYWQIPTSQFHIADSIHKRLNEIAPAIRSELISRNVLGRVPHVYFIRDLSNANIAAFEEALKKADFGPNPDTPASDKIYKDLFCFKSESASTAEEEVKTVTKKVSQLRIAPEKPADMKSNVCGLDHGAYMNKITLTKKKLKEASPESAVVSAFSQDLFSQIPGSGFRGIEDRDKLLKQFCLERKRLRQSNKSEKIESMVPDADSEFELDVHEEKYDEDFIEEY